MGNSSPGHWDIIVVTNWNIQRDVCRLSSWAGFDDKQIFYTFVIVTKTHCSSHCAKINPPSWHSWVSDSRGQWVSLGRNWFLFHRLRNTDSISSGDTLILFCFPGVCELVCKLCSSQASHSRAYGRCNFLHLIKYQSPKLASLIWGIFSCGLWIKRICEKSRNTWMSYEQLSPSD